MSIFLNSSLVYWLPRSLCRIVPHIGYLLVAALTVSIHSFFFMLSRICRARISPKKRSSIGEMYSFPSEHWICEMSVGSLVKVLSVVKSCLIRFSFSWTSVVPFVRPFGLCFRSRILKCYFSGENPFISFLCFEELLAFILSILQ